MALHKSDIVKKILGDRSLTPALKVASSFAPSNIALVKYWGKRNQAINLPLTSSLSISLGDKGTNTSITLSSMPHDEIILNNKSVNATTEFAKRLVNFLDCFRPQATYYKIETTSNIPIAAGLASSASGFAAIVKALDCFYAWNLSDTELSILSRMGSGSACRSIWNGFVEWQTGEREDGMDSHGVAIDTQWPGLCIGLLIFTEAEKSIGSSEAMQRTVDTSTLFKSWPTQVHTDLSAMKLALKHHDFELLGQTAEHNALSMHATMLSSWPPILYSNSDSFAAMQKVWQLRQSGIPVYFTEDAGPNLKLLFEKPQLSAIQAAFPKIQVVELFN
ncbi:MAG: diphosphomevalonate decarboxylase [Gammaproteobacteria bacterium]|nr:diphosphomevalonate decarboxylase [Gammaproteobacteria bacterium]